MGFMKYLFGGKQEQTKNAASQKADDRSTGSFEKQSRRKGGGETTNEKNVVSMEPKYIAVVGLTGSGLSQFIQDVTGTYRDGVAPVTSLTQWTTKIRQVEARIGNRRVMLVDTPGFVYSSGGRGERNPPGTFKDLASWVKKNKVKLDGVIWMHDIRNREIQYVSKFIPPSDLLQLCGYSKIIFVTSHWNDNLSSIEGEEMEKRVREGYWGFMAGKGSLMGRYERPGDGARASEHARRIVESLL